MSALAKWTSIVVPNGVWRGRRLGELLMEEDGPGWIRYAARTHADPAVRAAAYALSVFLDEPGVGVFIPELRIGVPLEGDVWVKLIAASDDDESRLMAQVANDPDLRVLVHAVGVLVDRIPRPGR